MRTSTTAALAALSATVLLGAGLATAGSAAADDTPAGTKQVQDRVVLSAVTERGNVRLGGADRYETAAEISRATWEPEFTYQVVLASGSALPDALAWGASGLGAGPLLLTERDRLPEATRAELERLRPCYLVVLGGPASVSDAVFADAEQYAESALCEKL